MNEQRIRNSIIVFALALFVMHADLAAAQKGTGLGPRNYTVSGQVTNDGEAPLPGVTMTFTRVSGRVTIPAPVTTDSEGNWEQSGFRRWTTYRVTPSKPGYAFSPEYRDFKAANADLNFTGSSTYDFAFVTTTDYSTGHFAVVNLHAQSASEYQMEMSSDAVARTIDGKIYVMNRLGQDNVTIFSPSDFLHPLIQFSTGSGSNPQDIVLANSGKAYISLLDRNYLLVVNPNTGTEIMKIDISSYADADGIPEAWRMSIVDGIVYVLLQELDRYNFYQPAQNGTILAVDTESDTVIGAMTLSGKNPYDIWYQRSMDKLIVSETGSFADLADGGIETINLDNYEPSGFTLTETALGGNVSFFVMKPSSSRGYVIVTDGSYNTSVVSFDLQPAEKIKDVLAPKSGFIHAALAVDPLNLLVADRSFTNPGIRIVSTVTDEEITSSPINTGLPPLSITLY